MGGVRLTDLLTPGCAAVLLIALSAVLYAPSLTHAFVYEDLNDPATLFRPWAWPGWHRLLTLSSYMASNSLSGVEPWGWHLMNVGLHLVNGWLVSTLVTGWGGVFALGLYLLHPVQVESVAYISARSDLLLVTCVLLAIVAVERRSWIGVVIACLAAVLAKESGVMALPLVLAWTLLRQQLVPIWLYLVPFPAATLVAWKFADLWAMDPVYTGAELVKALWMCSRVVIPVGLSIDHDWAWITPDVSLIAVGLLCLWGCVLARVSLPRAAFVTAWIGLALAPRLLMPLIEGLHEHHFALPMAGLALGIGASQKDT